jgi:hypothetical protein
METTQWAFIDDNNIVIHITNVDLTTMAMSEPIFQSYTQMIKCYEERGVCEIGMKWNWEINQFE